MNMHSDITGHPVSQARERIARLIEDLIAMVDELDGDDDREADVDQPHDHGGIQ